MLHSYITCSICNATEDLESFRRLKHPLVREMTETRLCFDCAFWTEWLRNPEPDTILVSGDLYKIACKFEHIKIQNLNRYNKIYCVLNPDTGAFNAYKDLRYRGKVPKHFLNKFPEQYTFITRNEYRAALYFNADRCRKKGCLDRYCCYWYHPEIEEAEDGAWNIIPSNYIIGTEECPSFINKNNFNVVR